MIVFPAFCKPFVCKATKIVKGERSGKRKTKFFKLDSSEPHSGFGEIVKGFRVVIS